MEESESESTTFEFSGGWLCLDFCNTADGDVNGDWRENLQQYEDLIRWSREAGIVSNDEANHLLQSATKHPINAEKAVEKAHALRRNLFDIFSAMANELPYAPYLPAYNGFLNEAASHLQIALTDNEFGWDWSEHSLEKPLWMITWSAAELLLSDKRKLVRECGSETCSWLFLDTSRNHSRRWCDMKGCGNRAKARRHYARIKAVE